MNTLIAQWHAEHVDFSRLLNLFDEQLAEFHEGGSPDLALMLEIVAYLREYGDRAHHPLEDAAFARLVLRDPNLQLPVNRLKQEHRSIAFAGEELTARLRAIVGEEVLPRASVETAAALYLVYYRHHLAVEERDILPRAAQLLTAQDWLMVAATAGQRSTDPTRSQAHRNVKALLASRTASAG
ncbi:MAG TPA: hemerythrin domain-containing protein [Variovorax sp.]